MEPGIRYSQHGLGRGVRKTRAGALRVMLRGSQGWCRELWARRAAPVPVPPPHPSPPLTCPRRAARRAAGSPEPPPGTAAAAPSPACAPPGPARPGSARLSPARRRAVLLRPGPASALGEGGRLRGCGRRGGAGGAAGGSRGCGSSERLLSASLLRLFVFVFCFVSLLLRSLSFLLLFFAAIVFNYLLQTVMIAVSVTPPSPPSCTLVRGAAGQHAAAASARDAALQDECQG